jgi:acylphosphatase
MFLALKFSGMLFDIHWVKNLNHGNVEVMFPDESCEVYDLNEVKIVQLDGSNRPDLDILKERIFNSIEQIATEVSEYSNGYLDVSSATLVTATDGEIIAIRLDDNGELKVLLQLEDEDGENYLEAVHKDDLKDLMYMDEAVRFLHFVEEMSQKRKHKQYN